MHMDNGYDPLKLENQLCFPLYAAAKEVVRRYKPFLDELGITYTQYIALMVLWEHDGLTLKQLGEYLYLDSGTLTPLMKKMEGQGLVVRSRSQEDERSVELQLTPKGRELKHQAKHVPAAMAGCMPLAADEAAQLYRLLHKLLDNL